ncbi:concanavalin A-like lectin/glucanase domain-containing protein [Apiosordaria backusii]|uniref:Glucanase n=1 Tax=Apiosordaria backusii TaxID=314023 RepID=A0AA40ASM5_9PEZI|nr:concanavalin A-like lectin/glucanase domain-containing protein [Apiosordaria backusii]
MARNLTAPFRPIRYGSSSAPAPVPLPRHSVCAKERRRPTRNPPPFQWTKCTSPTNCSTINGEVVLDANWRWVHDDRYRTCVEQNQDGTQWWNPSVCDLGDERPGTTNNCTSKCLLDGAGDYRRTYGITAANNTLTQKLITRLDFATNVGSRLFLLESKNRYQTFTLLGNELSFDVDLSTVECGINSALYFAAMDADGGVERHKPYNQAGAEYGTGYCDGWCQNNQRFVGGRAATNKHDAGWQEWQSDGACCPEFAVCVRDTVVNIIRIEWARRSFMGRESWLILRKTLRELLVLVVTRWEEDRQYQFFIQDGKRIDVPTPVWDGLPKQNGLSEEMCAVQAEVFSERDSWAEHRGWETHRRQVLNRPMVLVTSIDAADFYMWNTWLDSSIHNDTCEGCAGVERGPCPREDNEPWIVQANGGRAKVVWSNIRFGPIGSTVEV